MELKLQFSRLSLWQQTAFSAALLERMLPNYTLFSVGTGFGEAKVLRNQLDLIWQWLDKNSRCKINIDAQLTKLEEQIPDPEAFDMFGVFPAIDCTMALSSLLQAMQDKDSDGFRNISKLSQNSVNYYVELSLAQASDTVTSEDIENHPLMAWEESMQHELLHCVSQASENKNTCTQLKAIALEEGLSNLGIEIEQCR